MLRSGDLCPVTREEPTAASGRLTLAPIPRSHLAKSWIDFPEVIPTGMVYQVYIGSRLGSECSGSRVF